MAGELVVDDLQVEIQGVLLGRGTPYVVEAFNPWTYPDAAQNDLARPQRHGVTAGRDLFRGRRVPFDVHVGGDDRQDALDNLATLRAAFAAVSEDVPLTFRVGERTYRMIGRPRLADVDTTELESDGFPVACRFLATDPFIYDAHEQHDDATFPAPSDLYPDVADLYPDTYGDPLTHGRVLLSNEGTVEAPWRAEIVGPWANPTVQLLDPSDPFPTILRELTIDVDLADGQTLALDTGRESFHVDGLARLNLATLATDWFGIPRGDWVLRFAGDSGSGTVDAWTRSTWL